MSSDWIILLHIVCVDEEKITHTRGLCSVFIFYQRNNTMQSLPFEYEGQARSANELCGGGGRGLLLCCCINIYSTAAMNTAKPVFKWTLKIKTPSEQVTFIHNSVLSLLRKLFCWDTFSGILLCPLKTGFIIYSGSCIL